MKTKVLMSFFHIQLASPVVFWSNGLRIGMTEHIYAYKSLPKQVNLRDTKLPCRLVMLPCMIARPYESLLFLSCQSSLFGQSLLFVQTSDIHWIHTNSIQHTNVTDMTLQDWKHISCTKAPMPWVVSQLSRIPLSKL